MKSLLIFFLLLIVSTGYAQFFPIFSNPPQAYLKGAEGFETCYKPNQLILSSNLLVDGRYGPSFNIDANYSPIKNWAANISTRFNETGSSFNGAIGYYRSIIHPITPLHEFKKSFHVDAYLGTTLLQKVRHQEIDFGYNITYLQFGAHQMFNRIGWTAGLKLNVLTLKTIDSYNENINVSIFNEIRGKNPFFLPELHLKGKIVSKQITLSGGLVIPLKQYNTLFNTRTNIVFGVSYNISKRLARKFQVKEKIW